MTLPRVLQEGSRLGHDTCARKTFTSGAEWPANAQAPQRRRPDLSGFALGAVFSVGTWHEAQPTAVIYG